jgi:predicted peroxiredoxin
MSIKVKYATPTNAPVEQVTIENAAGYLDTIVSLSANGKAIKLYDRKGEQRVHVTVGQVDELIEALKLVKAKGVKMSVEKLAFRA